MHAGTSSARVLIVGVGGLGCPASLALAKGGVRSMTIVDPDRVELSNLHRQLWHRTADIGRLKVESAADRLRATFPDLKVTALATRVDATNAEGLFRSHDLVIDGMDGIEGKFLLSDAAVLTGTPLVYGGVVRLEGQALVIRRGGPCLRCLFEGPPPAALVPVCAQAGVLGSVTGWVGSLQAVLGLRLLRHSGVERENVETLFTFDGSELEQRHIQVHREEDCGACRDPARVRLALRTELQCAS